MPTAVHHLNCATFRPRVAARGLLTPRRLVTHVLIVERPEGLVLVDTGFGTAARTRGRFGPEMRLVFGAALDPAESAYTQIRARGLEPADVTDIVLTHLDQDHTGGIADFPQARVHVLADERAAATARATVLEKARYRPVLWSHGPQWVEHAASGVDWLGFGAVQVLSDDVLMVPLPGHTRGHAAVAVRRPSGGWLLHAGDAYFDHHQLDDPPTCAPGLAVLQRAQAHDDRQRRANLERLRALHAEHGPGSGATEVVTMFCAHDATELAALADVTD